MRARASGGNEAGALREARKLQIWLSSGNFPRASLFRRRRRRRFFLSLLREPRIYMYAPFCILFTCTVFAAELFRLNYFACVREASERLVDFSSGLRIRARMRARARTTRRFKGR